MYKYLTADQIPQLLRKVISDNNLTYDTDIIMEKINELTLNDVLELHIIRLEDGTSLIVSGMIVNGEAGFFHIGFNNGPNILINGPFRTTDSPMF